jgi:hypothetical protein
MVDNIGYFLCVQESKFTRRVFMARKWSDYSCGKDKVIFDGKKYISYSEKKNVYGMYRVTWEFDGFFEHRQFDDFYTMKNFVQKLKNREIAFQE